MKQTGILAKLQKLGKALMLPIAVLPIAGILLRFGQSDLLNIPFLAKAGGALFDNLPMLFAIGIAIGIAESNHGAAGLAGAISFYILNAASQEVNYALQVHSIFATDVYNTMLADGKLQTIQLAHFGGIIAGIIAGLCYNKFHSIKLPEWLGFFGGRRFVPIITGLISIIVAIPLGIIWPYIQNGLDSAAIAMTSAAGIGAFIYGVLNRLLIPFGLHHVINTFVWFNFGSFTGADGAVTTGDLNRFFVGDPTGGTFTAGFFPIMMIALPAAALAMYVCAKKENKASIGGALFSVAFTAFLCGITEPIEFMFMFLAPVLYGIHAILMGVSLAVCTMLGIHDSFAFSAGFIDFALNWGIAQKPFLLIILGLIFGAIYFFLFVFFIKKFDLKTPGREDDDELLANAGAGTNLSSDKSLTDIASSYINLLGGKSNIQEIESCITRIRLVLKDNTNIDEKALKAAGAAGVMKANKHVTQVIVGTKAELIVDEMKKMLK